MGFRVSLALTESAVMRSALVGHARQLDAMADDPSMPAAKVIELRTEAMTARKIVRALDDGPRKAALAQVVDPGSTLLN